MRRFEKSYLIALDVLQLHDHFVKAQYNKVPLTSSGSPGYVTLSELTLSPAAWTTNSPVTAPSPVHPAYASAVVQTNAGRLKANQLTARYSRLRSEISRSSTHDSNRGKLDC